MSWFLPVVLQPLPASCGCPFAAFLTEIDRCHAVMVDPISLGRQPSWAFFEWGSSDGCEVTQRCGSAWADDWR